MRPAGKGFIWRYGTPAVALLLGLLLVAGNAFAGRLTDTAAGLSRGPSSPNVSTSLVVSQVYGGAGCTGAGCSQYNHDYIEIFNRSDTAVVMTNWSVQYQSSTGTTAWTVTAINGTVAAGGYFLVQEGSGNIGASLPTPDQTGTINMAAGAGKVALVSSTTALSGCPVSSAYIDLVGYGAANCSEGSPVAALVATTAALRNSGGCTDTDNNSTDFTVGAPSPRNSATSPNPCGATATPAPTNTPTGTATPTNTPVVGAPTDTPTSTPTVTNTSTATNTATSTPTVTPTNTVTSTPTATATHGPSNSVVISEFRTRGQGGASDEFVELYNMSNSPVTIGGWKINGSSGCGTTVSTRLTITPSNLLLPSHAHFLATNTLYTGTVTADQTYVTGIADNGGIALLDSSNFVIDAVGMCTTTTYLEGSALSPVSANVNQSYERKPGGSSGSTQDTDDNGSDFLFNASSSDPQNLASAPVPPAATATNTPAPPTSTSTPVPPTATPTCPGSTQDVSIGEYFFEPSNIMVNVGTTIRWTNTGSRAHTTTGDNGEWNSGSLGNSQTYTFTFVSTGTFNYHCDIHPFMTGTITVIPGCAATPTNTALPTDTPTDTPVPTDTFTPTAVPTSTPTFTPGPAIFVGHVTWQGPPAQPSTGQQLPITLTLKMGATEINYPAQSTDASGFFTTSVDLPGGVYTWRVKNPTYLANSDTSGVLLTRGTTSNVELGLMKAGDCNNDNALTIVDVGILRSTLGKSQGDPGYDARADFTGDNAVTILDYNLLKSNFGLGGGDPILPGRR